MNQRITSKTETIPYQCGTKDIIYTTIEGGKITSRKTDRYQKNSQNILRKLEEYNFDENNEFANNIIETNIILKTKETTKTRQKKYGTITITEVEMAEKTETIKNYKCRHGTSKELISVSGIKTTYNSDGSKTVNHYKDSENNIVKTTTNREENIKNQDGTKEIIYTTIEGGKITSIKTYRYDKDDNRILNKYEEFDKNGTLTNVSAIETTYNSNGIEIGDRLLTEQELINLENKGVEKSQTPKDQKPKQDINQVKNQNTEKTFTQKATEAFKNLFKPTEGKLEQQLKQPLLQNQNNQLNSSNWSVCLSISNEYNKKTNEKNLYSKTNSSLALEDDGMNDFKAININSQNQNNQLNSSNSSVYLN